MTTSLAEPKSDEASDVQAVWWLTRESLTGAAVSIVVAAPLALIAGPRPWDIVGVVYAVGYSLFLLWTTGPLLFICRDAFLIAQGREPRMFQRVVTAYVLDDDDTPAPFRKSFGWYANPFANLTVSLVISAARLNPQGFMRVWEEAARAADPIRPAERSRPAEPTTQITRPLIRVVDRELQHC